MSDIKGCRQILIDFKAALGDTICLTGCLADFKHCHPNSRVVINTSYPDVFRNNVYVDDILSEPKWTKENGRFRFLKKVPLVYPAIRKVKKFFIQHSRAFDEAYEIKWDFMFEKRDELHLTDTIALQLGLNAKPRVPKIFLTDNERNEIDRQFDLPSENLVAISPHVGWISRQWPMENFKLVADFLRDSGKTVVQMGAGQDKYIPQTGYNLVGKTNIRQAARILEKCELLVCVDNGLYHLAAAVGTPAVVLFGPIYANLRVHPVDCIAIEPAIDCAGCAHKMDLRVDPQRRCPKGNAKCMKSISVEKVIGSCKRILSDRPAFINA